jgi:phosphoribosylaminoimidazolecarboxamide formyltransferase/IMP cyclohydrolase
MNITRALLSVSNKTGIVEFGEFLHTKGVELVSTGGTAKLLREKGLPVKDISEITNFPEMLDGRVKTLHPAVHGGILYVRGNDEHEKTVEEHKIGAIDLVVVNLYPFEETVAKGAPDDIVIENIDIGGPSMLRSAAKNFASVTVVCDPADLEIVLEEMNETGGTKAETRRYLAEKVFQRTAKYDSAIAQYFSSDKTQNIPLASPFPKGEKLMDLKYGENPHQKAEFYRGEEQVFPSITESKQLQGKHMGYCNILDADAALNLVLEFDEPTAVIIKHATPCGVALGINIEEAFQKALECDPLSAFGGIVALNRPPSKKLAEEMGKIFFEVIIAPEFPEEAIGVYSKKQNLRLLETRKMHKPMGLSDLRSVTGGFLRQDKDEAEITKDGLKIVVGSPGAKEIDDMMFAWKVCKHVKSNAIVLVKNGQTVGIGGGQTSRVGAAKIAIEQAREKAHGSVAASDAFFPFPDGVEQLAIAGVSSVIQPGGSKNDEAVFETAKKLGVNMILTGMRAFRH